MPSASFVVIPSSKADQLRASLQTVRERKVVKIPVTFLLSLTGASFSEQILKMVNGYDTAFIDGFDLLLSAFLEASEKDTEKLKDTLCVSLHELFRKSSVRHVYIVVNDDLISYKPTELYPLAVANVRILLECRNATRIAGYICSCTS